MTFDEPLDVSDLELAFPARVVGKFLPEWEDLPEEFKEREGKWARLASNLFFRGGKLPKPKEGISLKKASRHIRACLGSYEPKHEHKIAGVAWLLSLWFEEPEDSEE